MLHYEHGRDTILGLMPFFHIYGQVGTMLSGLRKGVRIAVLPKFEPELYMNTLQKYKVPALLESTRCAAKNCVG